MAAKDTGKRARVSLPSVLALTTIAIAIAGGAIASVLHIQSSSATLALASAEVDARAVEEEFEGAQIDIREREARLDGAIQYAANAASDFASARGLCNTTNNAVAFGDVRWCDVSSQRLEELNAADRDVVRYEIELSIAKDNLTNLEADREASLDLVSRLTDQADQAETRFSAVSMVGGIIVALLTLSTGIAYAFRRQGRGGYTA